jgi:hypothetical protein
MRLRNTNPLGAVELPLVGRVLEAGEEFDVTPEQAHALLPQVGNYEPADDEAQSVADALNAPADEPEPTPPGVTPPVDLSAMKVDELKQYAADRGIDIGGASKKDEIVAALAVHVPTTTDAEKDEN